MHFLCNRCNAIRTIVTACEKCGSYEFRIERKHGEESSKEESSKEKRSKEGGEESRKEKACEEGRKEGG